MYYKIGQQDGEGPRTPPDPWNLDEDQTKVEDWAFEIIGEEVG